MNAGDTQDAHEQATALLKAARAAGVTVLTRGSRLVVRTPKRLEPLARQVLALKPHVVALLAEEVSTTSHPVALALEVLGGQVISGGDSLIPPQTPVKSTSMEHEINEVNEETPRTLGRLNSFNSFSSYPHFQADQRPETPCPACGERQWWRGEAMWVCARCHPDPCRVRVHDGDDLGADRLALIDLARDHGWPKVEFKRGHSVVGTEAGWRAFARTVREEDLLAACHALEACREDKLS